jgi:hypothetical protein
MYEVHDMCSSLEQWKDIATIVGAGGGLLTLIAGVYSYRKRSKQKRIEYFITKRKEFDEEVRFKKILTGFHNNNVMRAIPAEDKRYFLGFLEEIALLMNSKMIPLPIVHYMFGACVIKCWEDQAFWENLGGENEKNSDYWCLFRHFVEQMRKEEELLKKNSFSMCRVMRRLRF